MVVRIPPGYQLNGGEMADMQRVDDGAGELADLAFGAVLSHGE
jgi:hypothetical protein